MSQRSDELLKRVAAAIAVKREQQGKVVDRMGIVGDVSMSCRLIKAIEEWANPKHCVSCGTKPKDQ